MSAAAVLLAGPVKPLTRRDAQREATRVRLFTEAVREFQAVGFAPAEVAVIAERAGVSRGTFYVHFDGKDGVLRELLLDAERTIAAEVQPLIDRGDPLGMVLAAVVDAVLAVERRLGRRLVRDICAAQFRPEFAQEPGGDDHPVQHLVVAAFAAQGPKATASDRATVFLTGLFGLLATGEGTLRRRRRHLDLLVTLAAQESTA